MRNSSAGGNMLASHVAAESEYDTGQQVLPPLWFVYNVRTWLNSELDPPPDLELSTMPEGRADNPVCIPP